MGLGRVVHLRSDVARDRRRPLGFSARAGVAALVAVVLCVVAAPAGAAATPVFGGRTLFPAGENTRGLSTADLNADGKLDVVAANADSGSDTVFLNTTADGATAPSFTSTTIALSAGHPNYTATGDLNGDGKPDVITADVFGNADLILINTTADGATTPSFDAPISVPAGNSPYALIAVDLNADGRLDLVTANSNAGGLTVRFNTTPPGAHTPTFGGLVNVAGDTQPTAVTAADLDGDGRPDLIAAVAGAVTVLLNRTAPDAATPSFAPSLSFVIPNSITRSLQTTDINDDGRLDLIVAGLGARAAQILLNTTAPGASTPSFSSAFAVGPTTTGPSAHAADLNADGKPDLVTGDDEGLSDSVWLNTTTAGADTPTFADPIQLSDGYVLDVTTGDVNGDGKPDLLTAAEPNLSVRLNQPLASIADASGTEASGKVTFALTLDVAVAHDTTVDVKLTDGTAAAPDDYDATTLTATFPAGQTTATVSVPVVQDASHEPDETFTATLANPSTGIAVGSGSAIGTIINTDPRYAAPTGGLSTGTCAAATPCDLITAINGAAPNDTVIVESGTYGSVQAPIDGGAGLNPAKTPLTIRGEHQGDRRPVIYTHIGLYDAGVATDLVIRAATRGSDITGAIALLAGASASRIDASNAASMIAASDGCELLGAHSELDDSVCWASGPNGSGVTLRNAADLTLRNDTAVGPYGFYSQATAPTVVNSIMHGTQAGRFDVFLQDIAGATFTNDEFVTSIANQPAWPGRVQAAPRFVDAAHGDFRQAAGAPSIDAGVDDALNGPQDVVGAPRTLGTHTDIGAYETIDATVKAATVTEAGTAQVAVTLTRSYDTPVTVFYATGDGTATAGSDYTATTGALEFEPGEMTKDIPVATSADDLFEGDETFTLTVGGRQAIVTITDDDPAPALTLTGGGAVTEGASATLTVTLDEAASMEQTVHITSTPGTATAEDFTPVDTVVHFDPGETSKTVQVDTTQDSIPEDTQQFTVALSEPTGGATLGTPASATIAITDDETGNDAALTLTGPTAPIKEGDSGDTDVPLTVRLSQATQRTVKVHVAAVPDTADATDFGAVTPADLTFEPGETTQTVHVPVHGDTTFEHDEQFTVALSSATGADLGTPHTVPVTIADDETPPAVSLSVDVQPAPPRITLTVGGADSSATLQCALRTDGAPAPAFGPCPAGLTYTGLAPGSYIIAVRQLVGGRPSPATERPFVVPPAPVPPVVTPPVLTPPVVNLPVSCTSVPLTIVEIARAGTKVRVSGLADARRFAGHTITILTPTGPFATTKVATDGTFTATANPEGATRFTARLDSGQKSPLFQMRRSITITARKTLAGGTTVTFKITRRHLPRTASIRRQVGCTGYRIIGHTTINHRTGRGTVTLTPPTGNDPLAIYRIVATLPTGETYTLPIAIPAVHRTRG